MALPSKTKRINYPREGRIAHIHERIIQKAFPTCKDLARQLEVSPKTIERDINHMRLTLGLEIESQPETGGYFYSQPVTETLAVPLGKKDILSLAYVGKVIEEQYGLPCYQRLRIMYAKMVQQLDPESRRALASMSEAIVFRPFGPEIIDFDLLEQIVKARHEKRALRFRYRNHDADVEIERHVHPYNVVCVGNEWFLIAYDVMRGAERTFALSRIRQAVITKQKYEIRAGFCIKKHLDACFIIWKGDEQHDVVIDFDPWATDAIRSRRWHVSQELIHLPGRRCRLKMRLTTLEEVDRWILGWGRRAKVIGPPPLIERVEKMAQAVVDGC